VGVRCYNSEEGHIRGEILLMSGKAEEGPREKLLQITEHKGTATRAT